MKVSLDKVVSIDYTLTNLEGTVIDSSEGHGPLSYLHGHGNIIPGLERELEEKVVGDQLKVTVEPKDGYGEKSDELVFSIPKENFDVEDGGIEIGMQFHAHTHHGVQVLTVVGVEGEEVVVDANHPLAGVTLVFDVKVVELRDATEEELAHGHVHGEEYEDDEEYEHHGCGCGCEGDDCDCDCDDENCDCGCDC
ncbi:peptidylprolyl isomerase [bacterium]|nr:peptidylprolyl isomerase [bacterium]